MIRERIKELRLALKLNQTEFANKIGIKQSSLSDIENKKTGTIDERNIRLICANYGVNEEWLRNGTGQMFDVSESDLFGLLNTKIPQLDEMDKKILIEYLKLRSEQRKVIKEYIKKLI